MLQTQSPSDKVYWAVCLIVSSGATFVAIMEKPEAERLFSIFEKGELPAFVGDHNFKCSPGPSWRFASHSILGMRVLSQEEVNQLVTQNKSAVTAGPFPQLGQRDASGGFRPFGS